MQRFIGSGRVLHQRHSSRCYSHRFPASHPRRYLRRDELQEAEDENESGWLCDEVSCIATLALTSR